MICPNCGNEISTKSGGVYKILTIVLGSLFVLTLVGIGVLGWYYTDKSESLNKVRSELDEVDSQLDEEQANSKKLKKDLEQSAEEVKTIQANLDKADEEKRSLNEKISSLSDELSSLSSEVATLRSDNSSLSSQLSSAWADSSTLTGIYSSLANLSPSDKRFYSNMNVIYLKKGESKTLRVTFDATAAGVTGSYTLSYKNSSSSIVTAAWGNWETNNISCPITLTASSYNTGTSVLTFTTSVSKDTFQVLVIVSDS